MNDQQGIIPPEDDERHELFRLEFERQGREDDSSEDSEALWNATGRG
jgi:hypothetical protein